MDESSGPGESLPEDAAMEIGDPSLDPSKSLLDASAPVTKS